MLAFHEFGSVKPYEGAFSCHRLEFWQDCNDMLAFHAFHWHRIVDIIHIGGFASELCYLLSIVFEFVRMFTCGMRESSNQPGAAGMMNE